MYDHGSLLLGTDGCGMYWHLIVTGPQRGYVWLTDENGAIPFGTRPGTCLMPGTPGFLGWVTRWAQGCSWFADAQPMPFPVVVLFVAVVFNRGRIPTAGQLTDLIIPR